MHCPRGQWVVELISCTATLLGAVGSGTHVMHCLIAWGMGSGTPAMHCHTA